MSAQPSTTAFDRSLGARAQLEAAVVPNAVFFIYCYFIVDYFGRLSARVPVYSHLRPTLVLVGILALGAIIYAEKFKGVTREPTVRTIALFLLYLLLSFPLVEWPGSVIKNNLPEFVKAAVFLFFTAFFVDTDKRLRIFVALFVGLQIFRVLEPLYLNVTTGYLGSSTHLGDGEFAGRLAGAPADVINPNGLGFVTATAFAFSHFMLGGSRSTLLKLLYLALVPALLYVLVLTSSRGGFLALLVVVFMILKYSRRKVLLIAVAGVMAVGAWTQMNDIQRDRYISLVSSDAQQSATVEGRWRGMVNEFKLGMNRPIFGHGLGTTAEAKVNHFDGRRQAAHNLYAEVIIETGLIGFLIFMAFLHRCYQLLRKNLHKFAERGDQYGVQDNYHVRLNLTLLTVFWMYAVYSVNYFGLSQDYWYLFAGLCIAFNRSLHRTIATSHPLDGHRSRPAR